MPCFTAFLLARSLSFMFLLYMYYFFYASFVASFLTPLDRVFLPLFSCFPALPFPFNSFLVLASILSRSLSCRLSTRCRLYNYPCVLLRCVLLSSLQLPFLEAFFLWSQWLFFVFEQHFGSFELFRAGLLGEFAGCPGAQGIA